ncbi:Shikimate kinase [compost metagenome]
MEGRAISDIFAADGEEGFRAIETRVLESLLGGDEPAVIATGGGAVLREYNRELMLKRGFVAALTASAEQIIARVHTDTSRPLLQGNAEEKVRLLLEQRKHAYDFAPIRVDTTSLTADEVVSAILEQAPISFNV